MNIGAGSYLEVTMPWIVHSDGYATKITGQLLHLEASTSLQVRDSNCQASHIEPNPIGKIFLFLVSRSLRERNFAVFDYMQLSYPLE